MVVVAQWAVERGCPHRRSRHAAAEHRFLGGSHALCEFLLGSRDVHGPAGVAEVTRKLAALLASAKCVAMQLSLVLRSPRR